MESNHLSPLRLLVLIIPLLAGLARAQETVPAPEIVVQQSSATLLVDGDAIIGFESPKIGPLGITRSLVIRNSGNAPLSGLALAIDGDQAADFTVSKLEVTTLAPGTSRMITITFKPSAIGTRTAALHIASNDADENPFDIKLSGIGVAPEVLAPEIDVQQSSATLLVDGDATVGFESPKIGALGVTRSLVIRNSGKGTLSGLALVVDGDHAADFTVPRLEGTTLPPGASRIVIVTFKPSAIGTRTAALHIASNDADENPFDIKLSGIGVAPEPTAPEIDVQQSSAILLVDGESTVGFESPKIGPLGITRSLVIRNSGKATLSGLALVVDGDHAADFTIPTLEVTTLPPGASRMFTITFKPSASGTRTAALHIASNDADENPFDIKLSGIGVDPEVLAPEIDVQQSSATLLVDGDATVSFESPKISTLGLTRSLVIRNSGNAPLSGLALAIDGDHAADFTVSKLEVTTLAPGTSRMINITFKPSAIGTRTAALHIASNDADENPFDIKLTGIGVAPEVLAPEIVVQKSNATLLVDGDATVGFESPIIGTLGVTRSLVIRNSGKAPLSGLALTVDGDHATDFTVPVLEMTTLAPGASRMFTITFKPSAIGTRTAALHIASNDADENPFDIKLTGVGVVAPAIEVREAGSDPLKDGKSSINFGTISPDSEGRTRTFTINNSGNAKLTGLSIRQNGPNSDNFAITPLKVTSLDPDESTSFKVTFDPSVIGISWAAFHIDSNDPDNASFDIVLTGKCASTVASAAALPNPTATVGPAAVPSRPVVSTVLVSGRKYRCITIEKAGRLAVNPGDVEVSSDLVHWFSGARYTTVLENNASVLRVRDNTPLTGANKRFIRLRKRG